MGAVGEQLHSRVRRGRLGLAALACAIGLAAAGCGASGETAAPAPSTAATAPAVDAAAAGDLKGVTFDVRRDPG